MKILVFSDSHGMVQYMCDAVEKEQPDYIIHLGDHDADADELSGFYPTVPLAAVSGNCDRYSNKPETTVATYGGLRLFICHGHSLGVKQGLLRAVYTAKEANARVLLFGHTHIPYRDKADGLTILNPGACGDKNCFGKPTYGVLEIDGETVTAKYDFI